MACDDLKAKASAIHLEVLIPPDAGYNASRVICNSRFDLHPCAIALCKSEDDIAFCLQYCAGNNRAFRVRSGGHQHEGFSSADDAVIIDVSGMTNSQLVWSVFGVVSN
jgi:FAD/FMN-containing dehydrogenase